MILEQKLVMKACGEMEGNSRGTSKQTEARGQCRESVGITPEFTAVAIFRRFATFTVLISEPVVSISRAVYGPWAANSIVLRYRVSASGHLLGWIIHKLVMRTRMEQAG